VRAKASAVCSAASRFTGTLSYGRFFRFSAIRTRYEAELRKYWWSLIGDR
jgi:hypothetical protein